MNRNPLLIPFCLFLIALTIIGRAPLATKGEAREGLVVKGMIEQNNYILPLRNSAEIPSKPPLFHWVAAAVSGSEPTEFSVRFPSPLFALIALSAFYVLLKRLEINAVFPLLVCASTFEWMRSSQGARVDMAFSSMLALSLISLFTLLTEVRLGKSLRLLYSLMLVIGFGGSILSKGPAGGVIPLLIGGIFFLPEFLKDFRKGLSKALWLIPPLLFGFGIAAYWYFEAYKIGGERFLDIQLMKENVSRLTGDGKFEIGHEKPFYWGPIELVLAFLPWSLALPLVVRDAIRERGFQSGSFKRFSLVVVATFILICSVASSKRPVYFLPVFPFLAYLISQSLQAKELLFRKASLVILTCYAIVGFFILPEIQRRNSVEEFSAVVNDYLDKGESVYQVGNDFYPTLFYSKKSLAKIESLNELPSGAVGIIREGSDDQNSVEILYSSTGKADDGKSRLLLARKRP